MTGRIEAVIADELASYMPEGDGGQDGRANIAIAAAILDALRRERVAVLELPKPCAPPKEWHADCLGAWPTGAQEEPVSAWPDRGEAVASPDGEMMSASRARGYAAALLAAASVAEAVTP